jgi:hypothetical protein
MGKEAVDPGDLLSPVFPVGMPHLAEKAEELAGSHGLPASAQLEELLDYLFGLSCRDQEEAAFDPECMAERRRQGFALAKSMQKQASNMLISLERLHHDWCTFEDQVQSMPALLEAIFNVDTGGPGSIFLPPQISILQSLFRTISDDASDDMHGPPTAPLDLPSLAASDPCPEGFWEAADRRLQAVIDLPLRSRLPGGPVPNTTVRDALFACQSFWIGSGRKWSMSGLKIASVRQENVVAYLKGTCEKFVADALAAADVSYNLAELHSAWEWVDSASRLPAESAE